MTRLRSLICLFVCLAGVGMVLPPDTAAQTTQPAAQQELFAIGPSAGGSETLWVVRTGPRTTGDGWESRLYARQKGGRLAPVRGGLFVQRALAITAQHDRVIVLLEDGQWYSVAAAGSPSPGQILKVTGGRLRALAADTTALYAVAQLPGGGAALPRETTPQSASTRPGTTLPATSEVEKATTRFSSAVAALVETPKTQPSTRPAEALALVAFSRGEWVTRADIPADVAGPLDPVSLTMHDGVAWLAVRSNPATLTIWKWADGAWTNVASNDVPPSTRSVQFVPGAPAPTLWLSSSAASEADRLLVWHAARSATQPAGFVDHVIPGSGDLPPEHRAMAFAWERFRAFRASGDTIVERSYNVDTFAMEGTEASSTFAPPAVPVVQIAMYAAVSMGSVLALLLWLRRRERERELPPYDPDELPLASIGQRMLAGMIDGVPIIVAMFIQQLTDPVPAGEEGSVRGILLQNLLGIGFLVFLLHVTIVELLAGRSLGKMLCRLNVTTIDGQQPTRRQLLTRNLLRVIDFGLRFLPLTMIAIHPLRQRIGDMAAGTIVISLDPPEPSDDDDDE